MSTIHEEPQSHPEDGIPTFGSMSCEKKQPWRDIVQQSSYKQPMKFVEKSDKETSKDIRLLEELDAKSR